MKKLDLAFVNPVTGPVFIDGAKPGETVFVLDPTRDGVQQIADIISSNNLHDLSAIQIVSHGGEGEVRLGSTVLTDGNLADHAAALGTVPRIDETVRRIFFKIAANRNLQLGHFSPRSRCTSAQKSAVNCSTLVNEYAVSAPRKCR